MSGGTRSGVAGAGRDGLAKEGVVPTRSLVTGAVEKSERGVSTARESQKVPVRATVVKEAAWTVVENSPEHELLGKSEKLEEQERLDKAGTVSA